jgi:FemAB-related protein (PEP-CTERM system-associated)
MIYRRNPSPGTNESVASSPVDGRFVPGLGKVNGGGASLGSSLGEADGLGDTRRGLIVRYSSQEEDEARDVYVRAHERSTVFHLSSWAAAVERAFHAERRDLIATEGDRIVGVLPLSKCRRVLGGSNWISAPWGVYGGPIADRPEIAQALVAAAMERAREADARRLDLRCLEDPKLPGLARSDLYVTFRKTLPSTVEEVESTFPRTERKYLRHAVERHGLRFEQGHRYLSDLHRLFLTSKRSLGSPGLPATWWDALESQQGLEYVLHAAHRGSEVLAVTLTFLHKREAAMYYVGTTADANLEYHATTFLIAKCMEWSVENGYELFDLGRSRRDSGACRFKVNQGFDPTPLNYRHALLSAEAKVPSFTPSNPKTALLRKTWSRLPLWACGSLSTRLATFLP